LRFYTGLLIIPAMPERGVSTSVRAIFHYACSPSLSAKLAALAPPWLDIRSCPESEDAQPHVAWLTPETLGRSLAVAMENCRRLRDGEELLHRVL